MASGMRQIVFRGELTGDLPEDTVKENLAQLFRQPRSRIEALFRGQAVVIKKDVDETTAQRFAAAFRKAGAVCEVHPVPAEAHAASPPTGSGKATQPSATPATGATGAAGDPNRTIVPLAVPEDLGGLELDTSGAPITPPAERAPPAIDTGGLALAEDEDERARREPREPPEIDTEGLDLEPPGGGRR